MKNLPGYPMRVLLVDDSVVNQKLASALLGQADHTVVIANNGREALEHLENDSFDLVLMDVQMPEMGGLSTTREIRRRELVTKMHIPIIAMTAQAMSEDRARCLEAGMDGYIAKPIHRQKLFATIQSVLLRGAAENDNGEGEIDKPSTASTYVDWEVALDFVQRDADLLREIVQAFLGECETHLTTIDRALQASDHNSLQRGAHTLKGNLRYFGAQSTMELARKLEIMGHERDSTGAAEILDQLRGGMVHVVQALNNFIETGEAR